LSVRKELERERKTERTHQENSTHVITALLLFGLSFLSLSLSPRKNQRMKKKAPYKYYLTKNKRENIKKSR